MWLAHAQVQYGYINLEEIFRDSTQMSLGSLVGLLMAKVAATSVCVGGGLVGGLFAPSLFLGALVGDIMGHVMGPGTQVRALRRRASGAGARTGDAARGRRRESCFEDLELSLLSSQPFPFPFPFP